MKDKEGDEKKKQWNDEAHSIGFCAVVLFGKLQDGKTTSG